MKIVLFDGVCVLCNSSVHFIIAKDQKQIFYFTALQSKIGKELLQKHHIAPTIDSIVLLDESRVYKKSKAVFQILKQLDTYWKVLLIFQYLPVFITDFCYDIIAKYRYRVFGKKEACLLPDDAIKSRFI